MSIDASKSDFDRVTTPAVVRSPSKCKIGCSLCAFGALSVGMTLLFKRALARFEFPVTLVGVVFALEAAAITAWERCRASPHEDKSEAGSSEEGSSRHLLRAVSVAVAAEVALSNMGLMRLSVSTHTMIKACTPLFVLLAALALRLEPPSMGVVAIVVAISVGTATCSLDRSSSAVSADDGDPRSEIVGVALTALAALAGGLRWGLTQLLTQRRGVPTGKLLSRTLPLSAGSLALVALALDARRLYSAPALSPGDAVSLVGVTAALASGGLALLAVEVGLVALTSSLSLAIASTAKELVLIVVSIAFLGDRTLDAQKITGFSLTASGIVAYNLKKAAALPDGAVPPHAYESIRVADDAAADAAAVEEDPAEPPDPAGHHTDIEPGEAL